MQHNDFTVALEDSRRVPCDHSRVLQQHFGLMNDGKVTVGAEGTNKHSINKGDNKLNINKGGRRCLRRGQRCCHRAQPTSALLVVAAELVVREKQQCVRRSIWLGEGGDPQSIQI